MIRLVEALHYRALRYVSQPIGPFQLLVGPNASGKSTFLDVIAFLGDVLRGGSVEAAIRGDARLAIPYRASDPRQLTWARATDRFELAIELDIPPDRRPSLQDPSHAACRYEVAVDFRDEIGYSSETLWLKPSTDSLGTTRLSQTSLLPFDELTTFVHVPGSSIPAGWKKVIHRDDQPEKVAFFSETTNWKSPFRVSRARSALASLPEDREKFPVATWVREILAEGLQRVVLSSEAMREPSPPARAKTFLPDGSNLPWVVGEFAKERPKDFSSWLAHVREALPDIERIESREREEDRHRYLVVRYSGGLEVPSWLVSDGTLRLLALTLLAYAAPSGGVYLIEEPENGIHPRAVENVFQSLSSAYDIQVLCATHSPVVLNLAKEAQLLCFRKDGSGATSIVRGDKHPALGSWQGAADLATLYASGVLG